MYGVVPARRRADRPRAAGVVGPGFEGVVRALAVRLADGVDRRQVDDVEAHLGDGGETFHRGAERPAPRPYRALGAREELVPGAVESALPVDPDRVPVAGRDQVTYGVAVEHVGDGAVERGAEALGLRLLDVAYGVDGAGQRVARAGAAHALGHLVAGAFEQPRA